MNENLTAANATHLLACKHQIGRSPVTHYGMRCHVLGATKSRKLKLLVFGNRYWDGYEHRSRIRYVFPWRVRSLTPENK